MVASGASAALVLLLWLDAPYGKFGPDKPSRWGPTIPAHWGWFIQESPSILLMLWFWMGPGGDKVHAHLTANNVLAAMFCFHYAVRGQGRRTTYTSGAMGDERRTNAGAACTSRLTLTRSSELKAHCWLSRFSASLLSSLAASLDLPLPSQQRQARSRQHRSHGLLFLPHQRMAAG